tara:strand:+ start:758921 stop:759412 length:492 start_codon:yes stop_codon:yes gene_type:complete
MNAQNEIAQNLHLKKLCMVIIAIALTVGACLFWHAAPFKIKDPSDPQFNPSKFRFIDYKEVKPLESALNTLFATGTTKAEIDKVLLNTAGASPQGVSRYSNGFYIYRYRPWSLYLYELRHLANCGDYVVRVCYKDKKMQSFRASTPCVTYIEPNILNDVCHNQ